MKLIYNLALATVVSLGILLLPIAAGAQCYGDGNGSYQCALPETTTYEESPYEEVMPPAYPIQGGTFWHKWSRFGRYFEKGEDHGKFWFWNNQNDWYNRYNEDNDYSYGYPSGYGSYGGPGYLSGFDRNPYWNYSMRPGGFHGRPERFSNGGFGHPHFGHRGGGRPFMHRGGPQHFASRGHPRMGRHASIGSHPRPVARGNIRGRWDNPPTQEELRSGGSYDILPESYLKKELGRYDNPPTPEELSNGGSYDTFPEKELSKGGSYDTLPDSYANADIGSYN